jgi:hypothetical protein
VEKRHKLAEGEYLKLLNSFVEVKLNKPDNFLKVMETLTRIGIPGHKEDAGKTLFQSCHILHKNNPERFYIVHFKEMFMLDGKPANFTLSDRVRRNRIIKLLEDFDLITPVKPITPEELEYKTGVLNIKVLRHSEKDEWHLEQKYTIGSRKRTKRVAA